MVKFSSDDVQAISDIVLQAKAEAYKETEFEPEPELTKKQEWPVQCTVGPGLEGAIACETRIGYVNGTKGWLIYQGYDIFDLCAHSSFEEVSYLLLHGKLPKANQLENFKTKLAEYRFLTETNRSLMSFPVQDMSPMAALRLGTLLMRQKQTFRDKDVAMKKTASIAEDEDSIPMETKTIGYQHAI